MNSNYVLYTDEERKIIDEMQMEENKKLFFEQGKLIKQNEAITNMIKNKFTFKQISLAINKPVQEIKKIATSLNII